MNVVYKKTITEKIEHAVEEAQLIGREIDYITINGIEETVLKHELTELGLIPAYPNWPTITTYCGVRLVVKT